MDAAPQTANYAELLTTQKRQVSGVAILADKRRAANSRPASKQSNRLFLFFAELRRRRVCRAAASYAVAMWLVCQILEVVAPALGMPDWTVGFAILVGLLGLPIALILSWLFEFTPKGLIIDEVGASERSGADTAAVRPMDRALDCALVFVALVIGAQLALSSVGNATAPDATALQKIVVVPFRAAGSDNIEPWSEGLLIELQHELAAQPGITVISPRDPYQVDNSLRLSGSVTSSGGRLYVTAAIVDNDTGVVTWSQRFSRPEIDSHQVTVQFAQDIVAALPLL